MIDAHRFQTPEVHGRTLGLDPDVLRDLYGKQGLGLATIAKRLGSDVGTVRLACQRLGMFRRHRGKLSTSGRSMLGRLLDATRRACIT